MHIYIYIMHIHIQIHLTSHKPARHSIPNPIVNPDQALEPSLRPRLMRIQVMHLELLKGTDSQQLVEWEDAI